MLMFVRAPNPKAGMVFSKRKFLELRYDNENSGLSWPSVRETRPK